MWTEHISVASLAIISMIKIMSVLVTTGWSCFWSKYGIDSKYSVNLYMPHYQSFNMHIICLSAHSLFNCTIHQQFHFTIPSHSIKQTYYSGFSTLWEKNLNWIHKFMKFTFRQWNKKCTNLLSFQVAQRSLMTLSFLTLNSFPTNKILL